VWWRIVGDAEITISCSHVSFTFVVLIALFLMANAFKDRRLPTASKAQRRKGVEFGAMAIPCAASLCLRALPANGGP
jgi:hypothetical protein